MGFQGTLQVDGYSGDNRLAKLGREGGPVTLALCWAHARRHFVRIAKTGHSPIADAALRQIAALYQVEKQIRGLPAGQRLAARQRESAPLIEQMAEWLQTAQAGTSRKSPIGKALAYLGKHWDGLTSF